MYEKNSIVKWIKKKNEINVAQCKIVPTRATRLGQQQQLDLVPASRFLFLAIAYSGFA